ncbi:MAG: ABC transporter substrate-binding protein [Bacillota bacterium]
MKKLTILVLLFAFVLSASVVTMAQEVELKDPWVSEKPQGEHGGTIMQAVLGDPKTFNTIIASETSSTDVTDGPIFEGLVTRHGVTTEFIPALAHDWEISEDGKVYTFYLREGVQWHDGEEFTADDVIFTMDVISDEDIPTSTRSVLTVDGEFPEYRKVDDYTVEFELPTSYAPFLNSMMTFIIPEHKLREPYEAGEFTETWGVDTEPSEIVGTGPFMLVDFVPGERIVKDANPNYWRLDPEGESLPYLDRWVKVIVESTEVQDLLFQNGEIHFNTIQGRNYERFEQLKERGDFDLIDAGPTFSTNFLVFNLNPNNPNLEEEPEKKEWFDSLEFRRAVAHAFDKDTMINQAQAGFGTPQWSPVSTPNQQFLNEDVRKYEYDLDRSRELLEEAGFEWDSDDNLVDWEGREVEFNITTNAGNDERETIMNIIADDLRELGMQINTAPVEFNSMVSQLQNEYDFDTILIGLTGGVEPHSGSNVWKSDGPLHMWHPNQEEPHRDWEARIDELFELGAQTVDTEQRIEYYSEFQEIIADRVPLIYTTAPNAIYGVRNNLENTEISAYGAVTWNIYEQYFAY